MYYKYLIIGGGMAAHSAVGGIRGIDSDGSIGMFTGETDPPYDRPHLSKGLWTKGESFNDIWRDMNSDGVDLHLRTLITSLDVTNKSVIDDMGETHTYEKLLMATGGTARRLPFGGDAIIYFRTAEDYRALRTLTDEQQRFLVIGGGFIGSEIASSLSQNGKEVIMVFPEDGVGASIYPNDLSHFMNEYFSDNGVEVFANHSVTDIQSVDGCLTATLESSAGSRTISVDGVVAGLGIDPNISLAKNAGLEVGNGIIADKNLSAAPDIFVAGDVVNYYNSVLERRIRVEHEDSANVTGTHAGKGMAGETAPFNNIPYFWSDSFKLGYEAMGHLDSSMKMVSDWNEEFSEGFIYYLEDTRVRGVLLWNVWDRWGPAGEIIESMGPFSADNLKGRIQ